MVRALVLSLHMTDNPSEQDVPIDMQTNTIDGKCTVTMPLQSTAAIDMMVQKTQAELREYEPPRKLSYQQQQQRELPKFLRKGRQR